MILIRFPYNAELIARVKRLTGARWSSSHKAWHVPDNNVHRACFGLPAAAAGSETQAQLSPANASALQRFVDTLRLKGYSPNTERTYRNEFAQLLRTLGPFPWTP